MFFFLSSFLKVQLLKTKMMMSGEVSTNVDAILRTTIA